MRILVITKRKAERDRLRRGHLLQQALKQIEEARAGRQRRIAAVLDEYGTLAERTGNADMAALVFQLRAVLGPEQP